MPQKGKKKLGKNDLPCQRQEKKGFSLGKVLPLLLVVKHNFLSNAKTLRRKVFFTFHFPISTFFPRFFANIIFFVYFCTRVGMYHPSSAQ